MSIRDEIAALGREQDALLSEHADWMARRDAVASPPMRKSDETVAVVRKRYENASANDPCTAATRFIGDDPPAENDAEDEFATAVERFAGVVERRLYELEKENDALRAENVEVKGLMADALRKFAALEGKLDAVLALIKPKVWKP